MNPENTAKLLAIYPLLYRNLRNQDFECEDGWFALIWQVSADIESVAQLEGTPKTAEAWPSVGVLKNKFGSLRVQFDGRVSDAIEALVHRAYERSMEICHLCGAPALLMQVSNRRTEPLCATCIEASPSNPENPRPLPVWMQEQNR